MPTTKRVQVGAGTLSGLMGGFFGMQGPPAVLYFIQSEPTKEHYMAMAQTYFLIGNVMMTIVRAYNGFFTTTVLTDYCFGLGRSHHRHQFGSLCVQAHPQPHLPLHRLCLHRRERCNHIIVVMPQLKA